MVSNEEDDAAVVAKIVAGEGDAAIVYESDISEAAANDVASLEIHDDGNVIATYQIAVVEGAANADLAASFVEYVLSADGQAALERYGFQRIS